MTVFRRTLLKCSVLYHKWRKPGTFVLVFLMASSGLGIWAMISNSDLPMVGSMHPAMAEHIDQQTFNDLIANGENAEAFDEAFEHGDELFETVFNAVDGSGAKVGDGSRFTRVPRADLSGAGQWAAHYPSRVTGPNAQNCNSCHNLPEDDGAGGSSANVHRDPQHTGDLRRMIQRNTPHVFGAGALQVLAEEMTTTLQGIRDSLKAQVCSKGGSLSKELKANGVSFGSIKISRIGFNPCKVTISTFNVKGVDPDLVVKPYQWKGSVAFLRDFNRGAAHNELGMQPVETTGEGVDGDYDGVADELTVGDLTAVSIYLAAQPRPTTLIELQQQGLIDPLPADQISSIGRGSQKFAQIGCAGCHFPVLKINNPVFSEPSQSPSYRDASVGSQTAALKDLTINGTDQVILGEDQPALRTIDPLVAAPQISAPGLDPAFPVTFDLTKDQHDNRIEDAGGNLIYHLGALRKDTSGLAMVELYGDLKRHYMGSGLAERIDEVGTGPATFLTENLWGVGSTGPYLHDGRATTLTEAILEHGGESSGSKFAFMALSPSQKTDVINFLNSLVLFKMPEEE